MSLTTAEEISVEVDDLTEKRLRGKSQSFDINEPPPTGRFVGMLISALNWLNVDDEDDNTGNESENDVYTIKQDVPMTYEALKKVKIQGRDYYSAYSLAYMQTWMLIESHNQVRRRHMKRCKKAFGELDYSGPVWTEEDDPEYV